MRVRKDLRDKRPSHRGDRGAAMVELAIAVPVFVSIMLGTITSGLALNDDMQLTHAVREGARYGAKLRLRLSETTPFARCRNGQWLSP